MPKDDAKIRTLLAHEQLRKAYIILIAGSLDYSNRRTHFDFNFAAVFSKPVTPLDLLNALEQFYESTHGRPLEPDSKKAAPDSHQALIGKSLLLVEDNAVNREVATAILEDAGVEVFIATNGVEALQQLSGFKAGTIDVILMDCQMPVMDGYEATRQIRKGHSGSEFKDIPIIALTANAMKGDAEKCAAAGMNAHLTKPIDENELINLLVSFVGTGVNDKPDSTDPGPADSDNPLKVWDIESLRMRVNGREDRLLRLVSLFLTQKNERDKLFPTLKKIPDPDQILQLAHGILGAASHLGCEQLTEIARRTEAAARAGEEARLPSLLLALELACDQVDKRFEQYLRDG